MNKLLCTDDKLKDDLYHLVMECIHYADILRSEMFGRPHKGLPSDNRQIIRDLQEKIILYSLNGM